MAKTVSAMEARKSFGLLLNQVSLKNEDILIERSGKPLARLVSVNAAEPDKLDFRDIGKLPSAIWEKR
ncbi:MAG: type II toxin-antitoxin system prevent-host-death family antitoxin [Fibrobacteraceae bacterium]|jgi:prevent-host-death family protein